MSSFIDYLLRIRLPIVIFVAIASFAVTFYVSRAERDGVGYAPDQPINFSHKLHAGTMKIDCQYCHTGVEKTRFASIPSAAVCMNCHTQARTDRPDIIKLTEYYKSGKPIPWKRIHRTAEYAYFNHSVHVSAGIDCASCHGDVANMDKVSQVKPFSMGACLDCHRNPEQKLPYLKNVKKGPEHCWACHR